RRGSTQTASVLRSLVTPNIGDLIARMKTSSSKRGSQQPVWTADPVTASPGSDAEFCDSPGVFHRFALKRTYLYELERLGLIKGCSLRKRGAVRGKKLWSIASIRAYLTSQMENGGDA